MCLFFINILSPSSNVIERAVIKVLKHSFNFSRENFNKNNEFLRRKEFSIHMSQIPGKGGAEVLDVNDSDSVAAASEMHKFFGPQKFVRSEYKT